MRKRKNTPPNRNTVTFTAGAPGSDGIRLEFTRNFDRSKLPPDRTNENMNSAVLSALRKSLASTNSAESLDAAERIVKLAESQKLGEIKFDAINVIVERAVSKKDEWFRIRPLLDHYDPEIKEHTNKKLTSAIEVAKGKRPL